jgi:5-methyltetrahydropteroyltriglutamate--homocysteine methyltransferase
MQMISSTDRILTTHVGSLPRPQHLLELMQKRERGELSDQNEFAAAVTNAVAEIVAKQAEIGIDIVSDGENGKVSYSTYIKDRLSGFGDREYQSKVQTDFVEFPGLYEKTMGSMGMVARQRRLSCIGPVELIDKSGVQTDIDNFKAALKATPRPGAFLNAVTPGTVAHFQPNMYYNTMEEYFEAVANAMRYEYEAIVKAGFLLQVDSPDIAMSCHSTFQDLGRENFLKQAELQVEALNHALANIPVSSVRMHVCWGNYEGPHHHDLPLETILPLILKVKAQAISFEGSNPRHAHEWKVWADPRVPSDKIIMPGVVDTSTNFIEHPELVAQRIEQFASVVGRERVIASSDCGFSTFAGTGKLHPGVAFKKLESLVEGARIASERLWK